MARQSETIGHEDEDEAVGGRHSPLRRCIVTGTVGPKDGMIRFVVAPDGAVVPDIEGTLPGRGLWLTAGRGLVEQAVAKRMFARAARRAVQVPPDLVDRLVERLSRRCLDLIGLARRAGQAVAGFEKVREALARNRIGTTPVAVLLAAGDGAADGRGKLRALASHPPLDTLPVVELFDAAALGGAFGRDRVVHAALARGGIADHLVAEARRLAGMLGPTAPPVRAAGGPETAAHPFEVGRVPTVPGLTTN